MTPALLATLRAAGEAATPGQWDCEFQSCDTAVLRTWDGPEPTMESPRPGAICRPIAFDMTSSDAIFAILARNHWDELLDAAEERDRLRAALRRYGNHDDCYRAGVDACPRYDNDNGGDPSRPCTCGFSAALGKEAP